MSRVVYIPCEQQKYKQHIKYFALWTILFTLISSTVKYQGKVKTHSAEKILFIDQ